jgi:hypothetical protein
MRVVELDGGALGEALKQRHAARLIVQPPVFLVAAQDVLHRGRDEEVLLLEAQLLALEGVVVRVEDLRDVLRLHLAFDRADVVAGVELAKVEVPARLRRPQAERVDGAVAEAGDRRVVGHGEDVFGVEPVDAQLAVLVDARLHAAVQLDREEIVRPRDLPGVAVLEPGVGHLGLGTVDDALVEDAVLVADAVAVGRHAQRRERVEETGGEAAEAAVAEPGVPLRFAQIFERVAELAERLATGVDEAEVRHGVAERATHEELEREVVDALGVLLVVAVVRLDPIFDEAVAHGEGQADVRLPVAVDVARQLGQSELQVTQDRRLHLRGVALNGGAVLRRRGCGSLMRARDHGGLRVAHARSAAAHRAIERAVYSAVARSMVSK